MRLDPQRIRKVLVRAPNWLGDVIMATPSFARIRSFLIHSEIHCTIKDEHRPVLAGTKSFDGFIPLGAFKGLRGFLKKVRNFRRGGFDLAILFPNSPSSALECLFAGIPLRLGYRQGRRFLVTHGLVARSPERMNRKRYGPRREPVPMADYYAALLDLFGMPKVEARPILRVTPGEEAGAGKILGRFGIRAEDPLLLLNPGAAFGSSKLWEPERWAWLASRLSSEGLGKILILAGPGEVELARSILARSEGEVQAAIDPLIPLDVLKPIVRRSSLMVTTDSGPRHIAVAFEVPHVVLMGPTHPGYTARNLEKASILRHEVDCGPCHLKVCPLDHRCMDLIRPQEALDACLSRLRPT